MQIEATVYIMLIQNNSLALDIAVQALYDFELSPLMVKIGNVPNA